MAKRKPKSSNRGGLNRLRRNRQSSGGKQRKRAIKNAQTQLWNLETGLTHSSISRWLDDPESFYLSFVEGWTPRRFRRPLEFGSIFHLMLEHQFLGKRRKSPTTVAKEIGNAYENIRAKTILNTEREILHIVVEQCKMIFPIYCKWWEENDEDVEWLAREQQFSVPYELVDSNGKRRVINLRGMRDGLFRNSQGMGIFETKTKDDINQTAVAAQLRADQQTLLYAFTAKLEQKKMINQVLYNIIRRPQQQHKNETVAAYVKRSQQDVEARPKHYFMRWHVEVDKKDYDNFESKTLQPTLRNFLRWHDSLKKNRWESPFHFLNLNALVGRYGQSEFYDMIINGRRSMYFQRSSAFPELDKSFLQA